MFQALADIHAWREGVSVFDPSIPWASVPRFSAERRGGLEAFGFLSGTGVWSLESGVCLVGNLCWIPARLSTAQGVGLWL